MSDSKMAKVLYVIDSAYTCEGDDGHPGRRNQVAGRLRSMLGSSTTVQEMSPGTELTPNSNILAILVHLTDVVEKHYSDLCTFLSKTASPVIAYSGGGASSEQKIKEQLQKKGIENHKNWVFIQSKLDSSNDFGDSEWRGLVDWLLNQNRPLDRDSLPAMISPARSVEYGLSLSLLCQGFLAHHALKPGNRPRGAIDTKEFNDVAAALRVMGWVNENGCNPEIVKELERKRSTDSAAADESRSDEGSHDPSFNSDSEVDFWRLPFDGGKSLRQGLEEECRSLRQNVQNKIQNGTLEWPDNATLPSRTAKLVEAIEKAIEAKKTLAEAATNNKFFDEDFICVVAQAYLDLNLLLEAV